VTEKKIKQIAISISFFAECFLIYIIYINPNKITPLIDAGIHSWINAGFNLLSAIFLTFAVKFIHDKKIKLHIIFIHLALLSSFFFLINYIIYHLSVGHVIFNHNEYRPYYLVILITHLLTSFLVLPLIIYTYLLGLYKKYTEHKKIAKWTFYIWEYVSVTGVLIVLMLKYLN